MPLRVPFLPPSPASDGKRYGFVGAHCFSKFVFANFPSAHVSFRGPVDDDSVTKCRYRRQWLFGIYFDLRFFLLLFLFLFFSPGYRHQILNKHQCFCLVFQYRGNEWSSSNNHPEHYSICSAAPVCIVANL